MSAAHDLALFQRGLELFNAGAYYAAHEPWEDLWLRNRSSFLQGLIQVTAALHHRVAGRELPALVLLGRARGHLEPHRPHMLGVDVAALLAALEQPMPVRIVYTLPDLQTFKPHAGSVPGPAAKRDWL